MIIAILAQFINTADVIAQVMASIYIAIAIFSGEQVATSFKSTQPHVRINPRRYIEYLNLWQASAALVLLPVISHMHAVWPHSDKATAVIAILTAVILAYLLFVIYNTLVHREIERRFTAITGSVSRLIAWTLSREKDTREKLKLLDVLFQRGANDTDLERYMLTSLTEVTHDHIVHARGHSQAILLETLYTLDTTLDKRPLRDRGYQSRLHTMLDTLLKQVRLSKIQEKQHVQEIGLLLADIRKSLERRIK